MSDDFVKITKEQAVYFTSLRRLHLYLLYTDSHKTGLAYYLNKCTERRKYAVDSKINDRTDMPDEEFKTYDDYILSSMEAKELRNKNEEEDK